MALHAVPPHGTAEVPGRVFRLVMAPGGKVTVAGAHDAGAPDATPQDYAAQIHPDDREAWRLALEASAQALTPFQVEYRLQSGDGAPQWVWSRGWPTRAEDGTVTWDCVSMARPAPDPEPAIDAGSGTILRGVGAHLPGYLFRIVRHPDGTTSIPYLSGDPLGLLGHPIEDIRRDPELLFSTVHPDDLTDGFAAMERARSSLTPLSRDYRRTLADGSERWIRATSMPAMMTDGSTVWDGIALDITEFKHAELARAESESRFRALFDNAPVSMNLKDTEGRYQLVNPYFRAWLAEHAESVLGRSFAEIRPDLETSLIDRMDAEVLSTGEKRTFEFQRQARDGSLIVTIQTKFPIPGADGKPAGIGTIVLDVSQQQRAEAAMRAAEQRFRALFDNAPLSISMKDTERRYQLVNPTFLHVRSQNEANILGRTLKEIRPELDHDHIDRMDREVLETGEKRTFEFIRCLSDGHQTPTLQTKFPIPGPDGKPIGIGTIVQDISQQKQTEAAMLAAEGRFRALFDNAPVSISLKDANQRYQLVNPRFLAERSVSEDETIGRTLGEVRPDLNSDAKVGYDETVLNSGATIAFECVSQREDGTTLNTLHTKFPIPGPDGKPAGIGTFVQDISQQKQAEAALRAAEERFREFAESSSDWLWETDAEGRFTYLSPNRETLLGVTNAEAIGKTREERAHTSTDTPEWRRMQAAVDARQPFRNFVDMRIGSDGRVRYSSISGAPVFDAEGMFRGYRGAARDITEERQREGQLREAQKMEAVGQLAGGIAHDFNNLMMAVSVRTELLEDGIPADDDQAESKQHTQAILRAVAQGAALTQRLLAFSRRQTLTPRACDLPTLIDGMVELWARPLGETVSIHIETSPDCWPVQVDPSQLETALLNLTLNARDAMPDGGAVTIDTENVSLEPRSAARFTDMAPGDYVRIGVRDTGTGIAKSILDRVFEPFFTTKGSDKGSGLGLSMVYGFAKQSGGHATIESSEGHGTVVSLFLPRAADTPEPESDRPVAADARGTERLLVVEDNEDARAVAAQMLRRNGYQVTEAGDGPSALERLTDSGPFDLLFTDIVLPGGMNGSQVAEVARRRQPGLRVLYTTGYAEDAVVRMNRLEPGHHLINKPYRRAALLKKLREVLASQA